MIGYVGGVWTVKCLLFTVVCLFICWIDLVWCIDFGYLIVLSVCDSFIEVFWFASLFAWWSVVVYLFYWFGEQL